MCRRFDSPQIDEGQASVYLTTAEQIDVLWGQGFEALATRDAKRAESFFSRAVMLIEELEDVVLRRRNYAVAAIKLNRTPFSDLAFKVAKETLALEQQVGHPGRLRGAMLSYGTALAHQERVEEAIEVFQSVLDISLASNHLADAASASTNLGATLFRLGQIDRARALFRESLQYLEAEKFPDTEIQTRLNLLSLYVETKEEPRFCLEFARDAMDRFPNELDREVRDLYMTLVGRAAQRFLRSKPKPSDREWLSNAFPDLQASRRARRKAS